MESIERIEEYKKIYQEAKTTTKLTPLTDSAIQKFFMLNGIDVNGLVVFIRELEVMYNEAKLTEHMLNWAVPNVDQISQDLAQLDSVKASIEWMNKERDRLEGELAEKNRLVQELQALPKVETNKIDEALPPH